MTTYTETIKGTIYNYFYDRSIKLWTVIKVDINGNQIGFAEYEPSKELLKANYGFKIKQK